MPIYDIGYRHWDGTLRTNKLFWPIARGGYLLGKENKLMGRLFFAAWTPLFYFAPFFFAVGYFTQPGNQTTAMTNFVIGMLGSDIAKLLANSPEVSRPFVWQLGFYWFFAYAGVILTFLTLSVVGPRLIADDLRSKAYLVYFSKPIGIRDYILGKWGVITLFMARVTLLPALVLYLLSIAFSPGLETIVHTAYLLFAILLSFTVLTLPIAALILFLSALVETRYATFLWIAIFVVGQFISRFLDRVSNIDEKWSILLSIEHQQRLVLQKLFSMSSSGEMGILNHYLTPDPNWAFALGCLVLLTTLCTFGLYRRIKAPLSI